MFWVLVTLSVVVYVSALAMRATVLNISGKYYGPGSSVATKNRNEHNVSESLLVLGRPHWFRKGLQPQPNAKTSKG